MNSNENLQKSYIVDMRNLYAAKRANEESPCRNMQECLIINKELDNELKRLQTLKQIYNLKDFVEPDDMYLIDPTNKTDRSSTVKYSPTMYNINLGVPTCNTEGCNTTRDSLYRINPNILNNFRSYEEQYMLNPRANDVTSKWSVEQKQQFKIYPHMYADTYGLMKEQEIENNQQGGISPGGVDYPIPMRFQLRYLQQPGHKGMGHNIDYDVHIRSKEKNLPEWHSKIMDKNLDLNPPDIVQQNKQRGINIEDGGVFGPTVPLSYMPPQKKTAILFDNLAMNMEASRNIIRDAANEADRTYGYYATDPTGTSKLSATAYNTYNREQQRQREIKQNLDIINQPIDWYQYKSVPRRAVTQTEAQFLNGQTPEYASVKRAPGPSSDAQVSGFFEYGPPIPPPNPELLSAVPSEMLVQMSPLAEVQDSSVFKVPQPENRDSYLLKTDLSPTINPLEMNDKDLDGLFNRKGSGIDQPTLPPTFGNNQNTIEKFDQLPQKWNLPQTDAQCGSSPQPDTVDSAINDWTAKELALQRIKFQLAHLQRLEPAVRQKQIYAKDKNNTIDINKSTLWLRKIDQVKRELMLLQSLIKEERNKIIFKLSQMLTENDMKTIQQNINVTLHNQATSAANNRYDFAAGGDHYFDKLDRNLGIFYTKSNFQGTPIYLGYGMYDFPDVGGVGNNQLSSFKIPDNTVLKLYQHPKKKGPALVYKGPARVAFIPSRYAHRISGIELVPGESQFKANLYSGMYFQGNNIELGPGFYDYPNVGGVGIGQLASFKVPKELMITLYSRPNKDGQKVTYIGPFDMSKLGVEWTNNVLGIEIQEKLH
jgi:hypothetical protein